ncbi:hypothetical protein AAULH_14201, partial [Lactobacillus helveticus MTCC 5463]
QIKTADGPTGPTLAQTMSATPAVISPMWRSTILRRPLAPTAK